MSRPIERYSHFDFAEASGNEAKGRLQFLCDLLNKPPVWLNKDGRKSFLTMMRLMREGRLPEIGITDKLDVSYFNGRWHVGLSNLIPAGMDPADTMQWLYHFWITNPLHDRLDGPCPCRRNKQECGKYYVRRTSTQKYCSRACGKHAAAVNKSSDNYAGLRDEKLKRVRASMRSWERTSKRRSWKSFVVVSSGPDITRKFLTQAVNKGDLKEPKEGK